MPRQIGLENLTVALVEEDAATGIKYATPIKLERSIKAKISPKTSSEKLYSDDSVEEILNNFDSCDVEIEINQLQLSTRALIQGAKLVNGILVENKDDIAPELALGFRSKKSNGKYRYVWLLKGKFEITEDEYETIGEKPTAQSNTISGSFYGRNFDGNWRIMEDEDSKDSDPNRLANWFKEIPEIKEETEDEEGTEVPPVEDGTENEGETEVPPVEDGTENEDGTEVPPIEEGTENEEGTEVPPAEDETENAGGTEVPPVEEGTENDDGTGVPPVEDGTDVIPPEDTTDENENPIHTTEPEIENGEEKTNI